VTLYIEAPLLNVNDEVVTLIRWTKPARSLVRKGEPLAVLETSKATFDLESPHSGYLHAFVSEGETVSVGAVIAALTEGVDEVPKKPAAAEPGAAAPDSSRKITKKAELAARKAGIDLNVLRASVPGEGAITESDVSEYLSRSVAKKASEAPSFPDLVDDAFPTNRQQRLLIIGGGLGAVQVLDSLARIDDQRATAIVDDNPELRSKSLMGVPVLGGQKDIEALFAQKLFDAAVVSVSTSIGFRQRMYEKLRQLQIPAANVIDPSARVQRNAVLGGGNVILAFCHIGSCAILGEGNFLSPYIDIEHHCKIGNFCTFGPGVMMSSLVNVGDSVKFGTGIFIEPKLSIGSNSIVGSGAILVGNVPENSIVKTTMGYTIRPRS